MTAKFLLRCSCILALIYALTLICCFAAEIHSNGTGGGLASATSTWVGGVVPGLSDSVVGESTDTISDDIPVWALGGLFTVKGHFIRLAAAQSILFASTGGTAWGVDMFGFDVCSSGSFVGTALDFSVGTLANPFVVSSVDGVSPIAFFGDGSCGSYGGLMTANINYLRVPAPCGSALAGWPCIQGQFGGGLTLLNSVFQGGWQGIKGIGLFSETAYPTTISHNSWLGLTCDSSGEMIDDSSPYSSGTISGFDNVVTGGCGLYFGTGTVGHSPVTFNFGSNSEFTSTTVEHPIFYMGSDGPVTIDNPIVGDISEVVDVGGTETLCLLMPGGSPTVGNAVVSNSVFDGCGGVLGGGSYWTYTNNLSITSAIAARTVGCQGCGGIVFGASNTIAEYSVAVLRGLNNGWYPFHDLGAAGGVPGTQYNHITLIGSLPAIEGTDAGISPGETTSYPVTASAIQNSIVFGQSWGIAPEAPNDTFAAVCPWGGGVCNNWTAGNFEDYRWDIKPTPYGHGFDDGINIHPSALYGDIWQETPTWPNMPPPNPSGSSGVGPYRGLTDYDALAGGPGTMADLQNCVVLHETPLAAAAGITSVAKVAACDPRRIHDVMMQWYRPTNVNQARAASDGTTPGAMQAICMGCMQ